MAIRKGMLEARNNAQPRASLKLMRWRIDSQRFLDEIVGIFGMMKQVEVGDKGGECGG